MPVTNFETFLRAVQNYPDMEGILGEERLEFPPSEDYGYEYTPKNALTFGSMGVDGVHYAILRINGTVQDDSPVIQISPMDFSAPYHVLADSFLSYLACACGVPIREMEAVFRDEREGASTLVPFLRERFDQSRFYERERSPVLDRYLKYIEPRTDC